jgi:hypothetical protein
MRIDGRRRACAQRPCARSTARLAARTPKYAPTIVPTTPTPALASVVMFCA